MKAQLTTDMDGALQLLQRAVPYDTEGRTTGDVRERLHGAAVFDLVNDAGQRVAAFALTVEGDVIRCIAAGAEPGADVLQHIVQFADHEARTRINARALQCETRRRGLVRKLQRAGFQITGYILQREVK